MNTMAKEHRNRYNMPLPIYMARYLPHCFITPQHMLVKNDKERLIFDAAKRFTAESVPINMMTSTKLGTELPCLYGTTLRDLLERIYDLRISFPDRELVIHANDVKSCFRQLKLHPDIMPTFSIMVADFLFLQAALPFGVDFSPQSWEICRRIIEVLAERLFKDTNLRDKHRKYLDRIKFSPHLRKRLRKVTPAKQCRQRRGVRTASGTLKPTPHRLFVDDAIYVDIWDVVKIEQAIAASIEAIFVLLGVSGKPVHSVVSSQHHTHRRFTATPVHQSLTSGRTQSRSTNSRRCSSPM